MKIPYRLACTTLLCLISASNSIADPELDGLKAQLNQDATKLKQEQISLQPADQQVQSLNENIQNVFRPIQERYQGLDDQLQKIDKPYQEQMQKIQQEMQQADQPYRDQIRQRDEELRKANWQTQGYQEQIKEINASNWQLRRDIEEDTHRLQRDRDAIRDYEALHHSQVQNTPVTTQNNANINKTSKQNSKNKTSTAPIAGSN